MTASSPEHVGQESLRAWQFIVSPQGTDLLDAASQCEVGNTAAMARLRRTWTLEQVAAAMELTEARRRAVGKIHHADSIVADRIGLEQATGSVIADYKANRVVSAGVDRLSDLCCGIGGDAMAFAAHLNVIGFDLDPLKTWMTGINAKCPTRCVDVLDAEVPSGPIHIDPTRRDVSRGERRHDPESWTPRGSDLQVLLESHPDAIIKMGPGIDQENLSFRDHHSEVEFISLEGALSQAILWTGCFAQAARRATRCSSTESLTISGDQPDPPPLETTSWTDHWLHIPDPALERAELLGPVCREWNLFEPAAGLGLLIGSQAARTPWLIPYQVVEHMPWRLDKIKAWLRTHDAGPVEIRTRGRAITEVDKVRSQLQGEGSNAWTVFGLRLGESRIAVITHPRGR
ncbi:MAG: hypothetical protein VX527_05490 [Planctomycetota bacterium]|nr:hypothetical protein [Planctomycetota bacterium]